jgi:hypothetical protein
LSRCSENETGTGYTEGKQQTRLHVGMAGCRRQDALKERGLQLGGVRRKLGGVRMFTVVSTCLTTISFIYIQHIYK